jgi:hypothetical protein
MSIQTKEPTGRSTINQKNQYREKCNAINQNNQQREDPCQTNSIQTKSKNQGEATNIRTDREKTNQTKEAA